MLIAVQEKKFIVPFVVIIGTISFLIGVEKVQAVSDIRRHGVVLQNYRSV